MSGARTTIDDVDGTLTILMDQLFQIGVPIESVRIVSAAVRQAMKDATKATPAPKTPAPKNPRAFLKQQKGA